MDTLFFLGRVLFGGYFVMASIMHFTKLEMMAQYAGSKHVPMPRLATIGTGIMILLGGLGIIVGAYVGYAVLLLSIFLIPTSFVMHNFWKETDQNMKMISMQMFLKNMVMFGAVLMMLAIPQPWALTLL